MTHKSSVRRNVIPPRRRVNLKYFLRIFFLGFLLCHAGAFSVGGVAYAQTSITRTSLLNAFKSYVDKSEISKPVPAFIPNFIIPIPTKSTPAFLPNFTIPIPVQTVPSFIPNFFSPVSTQTTPAFVPNFTNPVQTPSSILPLIKGETLPNQSKLLTGQAPAEGVISAPTISVATALRTLLKQKEFVSQLQGPSGPQGPEGQQGPMGTPGLIGPSGPSGPAGFGSTTIIQSSPTSSGATAFNATNLSGNHLSTGTATITELTVKEGATIGGTLGVTGALSVAGISITGSVTTSALTASRLVFTDASKALTSSGDSSAISGAVSDETGTGVLVLATSPTLVTPNIGAATGTSLATSAQNIFTATAGTSPLIIRSATATDDDINFLPFAGGAGRFAGIITSADITTPDKTWTFPDFTGTVTVAATSVTATQAMFATTTAGAPAFRAIADADIPNTITIDLATLATNVTTNADLTGAITSTGNATILGSFSSASLLTAVTGETGTDALVFANTPTLVTPNIGAATGTSLALTYAGTSAVTTASGLVLNANSLTTGTGFYAASSTLTSGKLVDLQVSGTAAAASQTALNILTAGATATNAITTYGAQISNTHTNAVSGTNVALYLNASGATTANYGLIVDGGNVGIGTTSPGAKLDVQGGALRIGSDPTGTIEFKRTSDNWHPATIHQSYAGNFGANFEFRLHPNDGVIGTAPTTRLYIQHDGNVGIGVTDPEYRLHVGATTPVLIFEDTDQADATEPYYFLQSAGGRLDIGYGDRSAGVLSGAANTLTVSSGNVGIGTTTPGGPLHVYGAGGANRGQLSIGSPTTNAYMTFYEGSTYQAYIQYSGGDLNVQNYSNGSYGDLNLNPSGGNVGIGTTSPGS
ncbi:MAG: hypothetical protein Q7K54_02920, partial [Candidatus Parcubacteria bacterium]|nr:hypothetical protein [Candidatus Parcubacteria bacterium]